MVVHEAFAFDNDEVKITLDSLGVLTIKSEEAVLTFSGCEVRDDGGFNIPAKSIRRALEGTAFLARMVEHDVEAR